MRCLWILVVGAVYASATSTESFNPANDEQYMTGFIQKGIDQAQRIQSRVNKISPTLNLLNIPSETLAAYKTLVNQISQQLGSMISNLKGVDDLTKYLIDHVNDFKDPQGVIYVPVDKIKLIVKFLYTLSHTFHVLAGEIAIMSDIAMHIEAGYGYQHSSEDLAYLCHSTDRQVRKASNELNNTADQLSKIGEQLASIKVVNNTVPIDLESKLQSIKDVLSNLPNFTDLSQVVLTSVSVLELMTGPTSSILDELSSKK